MRSMKFSPRLAIEPQTIGVVVRRDNLCTTGSLAGYIFHVNSLKQESRIKNQEFYYANQGPTGGNYI